MRTNRTLVSLDALLDTRVGLLLEHKPHLHDRLDVDAYRKRITDAWTYQIGWTLEEFTEAWKNRTVECLKQSRPTELLLNGLWLAIEERFVAATIGRMEEKPVVTINMHPYNLLDEEAEAIVEEISNLYPTITITYGSWSEEELNPTFLRKNWDCAIMYDWYRWIEVNGKHLGNRIPKFIIYRPSLLHSDLTPEAVEAIKAEGNDPFNEAKKFLAEYVGVEARSAELFSC